MRLACVDLLQFCRYGGDILDIPILIADEPVRKCSHFWVAIQNALDKGPPLSSPSIMDKELDRYELLAHPNPPNPVKAKAPPIGSTLADLAAQLRQSREMLLNGSCATPQSVQEIMRHITPTVEKSKGLVDDRLKETHASSVKLAKFIDKVRCGRCAPLGIGELTDGNRGPQGCCPNWRLTCSKARTLLLL